jgi:uncharacterized repeat protein (TIGR03806 family)
MATSYKNSMRFVITIIAISCWAILPCPVLVAFDLPTRAVRSSTVRPAVPSLNLPIRLPGPLPPQLSGTGAFQELSRLSTSERLIPYKVNVALWSDGAAKQRWIALPKSEPEDHHEPIGLDQQIGFSAVGSWTFPAGTVFVKHFEMVMGQTSRRLETRYFVIDDRGGAYGVTYRWRPDGSDADLLKTGETEEIAIRDSGGQQQTLTWQYPSRSDCMTCHTEASGYVLGVNARQLNRDIGLPSGKVTDQLRQWNRWRMFTTTLPDDLFGSLDRLAPLDDDSAPLEKRVRSYLDANCAGCHRPGEVRGSILDLRFDTPLARQRMINGPVETTLDIAGARAVVPGNPARSVLLERMKRTDARGRMPQLGRLQVDDRAVSRVEEWIRGLNQQ